MNAAQRWLLSITTRLVPSAGRLLETALGHRKATAEQALMAAARELGAVDSLRESWQQITAERELLHEECQAIAGSGPALKPLKERWWDMELALEDRGWQRQLALATLEFSQYGIHQIILIARLYSIKNPLIKRAISIKSMYVFGRGFDVTSDDPATNQLITDTLEQNKAELGHIGLVAKDKALERDGNLFFAFFSNISTGDLKVRMIDPVEIIDVVTDPDDSATPWFYHRQWSADTFDFASGIHGNVRMDAWYPALDYDPAQKLDTIGGFPVDWETPLYHVKIGSLDKWKFGLPNIYTSIDWARSYKRFLENWSSITEALARFALTIETKGGQQAIQQFSQALSTTLANAGTTIESNPPPIPASTFVAGPGTKIAPLRTAGATTEPEQGRRVLLMVAAAEGLPETFFGDASVGSLATAASLDRPTELMFLERQELWREVLQKVYGVAVQRSRRAPNGKLFEASVEGRQPAAIKVNFPSVLEHDIKEMVEAIVAGATLNGFSLAGTMDVKSVARAIWKELGIENFEEAIDAMYPDGEYDPKQPDQGGAVEPAAAVPDPGQQQQIPAKNMAEAIRRILHEGLRRRASTVKA